MRGDPLVIHMMDGLGSGGAEQVLTVYAPRLRSLGKDIRVVVLKNIEGNPQSAALAAAGIPVEFVEVDGLSNFSQIIRLFSYLRRLRPALIHAHSNFSNLLCSIGRVWHRAPVVTTLHTYSQAPSAFANRGDYRRLLGQATTALLADRVIVLSASGAKKIRQRYPRAAIELIPNGIDVQGFNRLTRHRVDPLRRSLGLSENNFVVLSVAVLRRPKGIDKLIAAFARFAQNAPEARLVVVGDGEELETLKAQVGSLGIEAAVRFTGFRRDVHELMAAADIFVLPTLDDAQPTVIMEAMASGLPVVSTRVGGIPDMIEHGVDGLLTPAGDVDALDMALRRLREDTELRVRLGAAGRRSVEAKFSLERQAAKINSLYECLIGERGSGMTPVVAAETGGQGRAG